MFAFRKSNTQDKIRQQQQKKNEEDGRDCEEKFMK